MGLDERTGRRGLRGRWSRLLPLALVPVIIALLLSASSEGRRDVAAATGAREGERSGAQERRAPREVNDAPPRALLELMAVLRRPQTEADRRFSLRTLLGFETVAVDYVRYLGRGPRGRRFYLVPGTVRRQGQGEPAQELRLSVFNARGGGGGRADAEALLNNKTTGTSQDRSDDVSVLHGLVPDGVTRVDLRFRREVRKTVRVRNNFWVTTGRRLPSWRYSAGSPVSTVWRGADGRIIRLFRIGASRRG